LNDIIKFCEANFSDVELKYAKLFFENASGDAKKILERLCRHNKDNMIIVLKGIAALERVKVSKDRMREMAIIEKEQRKKFEETYYEAASSFIILYPERSKKLMREFNKFFSFITRPTAYDPLKRGITYNSILKDLVETLIDEYPLHTENSILKGLSEFLNELGCKSPQNKPFNRQILHSLIKS
jgi:hypothetical protein